MVLRTVRQDAARSALDSERRTSSSVDSYFPAVDALEDLLEQFERDIFTGSPPRDTAARIHALKGDSGGLCLYLERRDSL
jgi:hypothetical protein